MANINSDILFSDMTTLSSAENNTSLPIVEDLCAMDSMPDFHTYTKGIFFLNFHNLLIQNIRKI